MRRAWRWVATTLAAAMIATALATLAPLEPSATAQQTFSPISGGGSTWSQNAVDQWRRNVQQFGIRVDFAGTGSSDGRNKYRNGTYDFAVSEIPYGIRDGNTFDPPPDRRGYAYMPIVAGGTAFMYNLVIAGERVTNLRLSGDVISKIFTGQITQWNDPEIREDNPQLNLPAVQIVPVVRSDGSGTSAQFTQWMADMHPEIWGDYCERTGRSPCTQTSNYPVVPGSGFIAQAGSLNVAGYVSRSSAMGAITYVEYSYALNAGFPVAKVRNESDYYIEPTARAVAVGLLRADINRDPNSDEYLTQELGGVYRNSDRRAYPLSSYSYMILPTDTSLGFSENKGYTLAEFGQYFLCEGQQQAEVLGYSPLPINLVEAGQDQLRRIPGAEVENINISSCNNPTFSTDGTNTLAETAPQPPDCDRAGPVQCSEGTGGAEQETPLAPAQGGNNNGGNGNTGGNNDNTGGNNTGGGNSGGGGDSTAGNETGGGDDSGGSNAGNAGGGNDSDTGSDDQPVEGGADPSTEPTIDPDTGEITGGGDLSTGSGQQVAAVPVSTVAASGWRFHHTLMVLAAALLLGVIVGPPLLTRAVGPRPSPGGPTSTHVTSRDEEE